MNTEAHYLWGSAKSTQFYYVMLHAMGGVLLSSYPSKIIFSPHWCGYNAAINAAKCGEMRLNAAKCDY